MQATAYVANRRGPKTKPGGGTVFLAGFFPAVRAPLGPPKTRFSNTSKNDVAACWQAVALPVADRSSYDEVVMMRLPVTGFILRPLMRLFGF